MVVSNIDTDAGVLKSSSYFRDLLVFHSWIFKSNEEIIASIFPVEECPGVQVKPCDSGDAQPL